MNMRRWWEGAVLMMAVGIMLSLAVALIQLAPRGVAWAWEALSLPNAVAQSQPLRWARDGGRRVERGHRGGSLAAAGVHSEWTALDAGRGSNLPPR